MAFTYVTLDAGSGYVRADGTTPRARILATPLVPMTNGPTTVNRTVAIPLQANGLATKTLQATTDPGTTPAGNAYRFSIEIDGAAMHSFVAAVPHNAGSTIDISSLVPLVEPPVLAARYDLVVLTAAAYNALPTPDPRTLYAVIN